MYCAFSPRVYLRRKWWALLVSGIALVCMVVNITHSGDALPLALEVVAFVVPLCRLAHRLLYRKKDYIELQPQCVIVYQLRDGWTMRDHLRVEIHGVSDLRITPERITVIGACDAYIYRRDVAQQAAPTRVNQIDFMRYFDHDAAICEKLENMRKEYGYGG